MEFIIFGLYALFALNDQHIKNFLIEANKLDEIKYQFVKPTKCESGARKKTYVLAPTGKVVIKQVSEDGTLGKTCD